MIRGVYTAASGMMSNSRAIDTRSNNMANSSTAGFKKDEIIFTSFGDALTYRMGGSGNAPLGATSNGVVCQETYTRYEQSPLDETGRSLDFAIEGEGFFTLQKNDGSLALTRNGQFIINPQGYLTDNAGNQVLGQDGPLQVGGANFTVNSQGGVYTEGEYLDTLRISSPEDTKDLQKQEGGLLGGFNPDNQKAFAGSIRQGSLESSNLELATEMAGLIESSRAFQSCSQIVKMLDSIMERTVNEIGRM